MSKIGISRRRFLKIGLSCLAGSAAGLGLLPEGEVRQQIKAVSRTSLKSLQAIPTSCEQCPAGCGIIAYLDGERLVQILGNPDHPNNQGGICAKGIAGINLVNDPERLLYPMRRTGARGAGQWTKITWDEAYSALSERIKEMIRKGKIGELVIDKGQDDPLLDHFIAAIGQTSCIDRPGLEKLNRDAVFKSMVGSPFLIEDVGRSRTILNFGANPYANHDQFIGIARRLVSAQTEKGARLFTFDVRMSETAAKSEAWYPIKAGTDGVVALAMARVIVEIGLVDGSFFEQRTNCRLSKLKEHLVPYTPEFAERESGVKAADIERMAVEFATQKPSVAIIGGGIIDHENGSQNVRCVALLNWLVGNLEKEGGLFFPRPHYNVKQKSLNSYRAPLNSGSINSGNIFKSLSDLYQSSLPVDTYFACLSNPAYDEPDCNSTARLLKDEKIVPFLVVMDTHLTETAMIADMVLPAATYLEGWGLSNAPSLDIVPVYNLRQPVVSLLSTAKVLRSPSFDMGKLVEPSFEPRGESKEIGNFCLELARWLGENISKNFPYKDTLDYINEVISSVPGLKNQGGLEALKNQGLWVEKDSEREKEYPYLPQRVEIDSDIMRENGHSRLPEYQPIASHKKMKEDELVLTTFKSNLESRGAANSKWAKEIEHENRLWINKEVALRLNIENGDVVRVSSPAGSFISRVLTTNRIHHESAAMAEGSGHTALGNVAKALRFKSNDRDTNLIWWGKKGNGVNPKEIIERRIDKIGGGLALKDTVIRIEKI